MPTYARKRDIGPIFGFAGVARSTLGATFSVKKSTFQFPAFVRNRSWNRPGRDWAPETLQGTIFIDFLMLRIIIEKSLIFQTLKNLPKWQNQSTMGRPGEAF